MKGIRNIKGALLIIGWTNNISTSEARMPLFDHTIISKSVIYNMDEMLFMIYNLYTIYLGVIDE